MIRAVLIYPIALFTSSTSMLFMVPIYSIVSWLSYLFYSHSIYYETVRDCYEAVVIVSFFNLLLQYVGETTAEQNAVFATVRLEKWFWPLGKWRYRPRGLHFLWLMKGVSVTTKRGVLCRAAAYTQFPYENSMHPPIRHLPTFVHNRSRRPRSFRSLLRYLMEANLRPSLPGLDHLHFGDSGHVLCCAILQSNCRGAQAIFAGPQIHRCKR